MVNRGHKAVSGSGRVRTSAASRGIIEGNEAPPPGKSTGLWCSDGLPGTAPNLLRHLPAQAYLARRVARDMTFDERADLEHVIMSILVPRASDGDAALALCGEIVDAIDEAGLTITKPLPSEDAALLNIRRARNHARRR
jgi:hypothetical protein